ncbi:hypothetical protein ACFSBZ_09645 [Amnibacterium flavum]|uniref:Uncharacterized protein n=1 Tax=Amnibacterium flavum TaxID=2173173 RepID=A0A2V1HVL0_9MICO|nr:hypothetical protein [Amnibacterium flavum]PVZ95119.1 hypothetical protein DDQ50_00880 [Amnibacterium flavum]
MTATATLSGAVDGGFGIDRDYSLAGALARLVDRFVGAFGISESTQTLDEGLWFVRTLRGGGFEVLPYRRGRLAFTAQAADSLLRMGSRDVIRVREVLDSLAASARRDAPAATADRASLFVAGDSLVLADYPSDGPAMVVTQLA